MKFRLLGIQFELSFFFFAILTLTLLLDRTGFAAPMLFAMLLHETGHLLAMKCVGSLPRRISLMPGAIEISSPFESCDKPSALFIVLAGPAANFSTGLLCYCLYSFFTSKPALIHAAVQCVIGLFNLLPVKGMDGGSALQILLYGFFPRRGVDTFVGVLSFSFALAVIIFGALLWWWNCLNLSMLVFGFYLLMFCFARL